MSIPTRTYTGNKARLHKRGPGGSNAGAARRAATPEDTREETRMTPNCSDTAPPAAGLLPAHQPGQAVRAMKTAVLSHRVGAAGLCSDAADDRCYPSIPGQARGRLAEYARARCLGCTVIEECLELALRIEAQKKDSSHGIWGGTAPWERRDLIEARKAARRD
jgi:Transcription factor WhiB